MRIERSRWRAGRAIVTGVVVASLWTGAEGWAQQTGATQPYGTAPSTTAYPSEYTSGYPAYPTTGGQPGAVQSSSLKNLFAASLGAALAATGAGVVGAIGQGIVGGIAEWFSHKHQSSAVAAQPAYGSTNGSEYTYPPAGATTQASYPGTATSAGTVTYPANSGYATPAATAGAYPSSKYDPSAQSAPSSAYPGTTAYGTNSTTNATYGDPTTMPGGSAASIYAGVAYEVHLVDAAGGSMAVDPGTYSFRSGDRFVVYYRPSLPGYMEVFNINGAGRQTKIDDAQMAAGQLMKLGPYEFTGTAGDESLTIVLTPCSTPQLLTATRDIVNVGSSSGGSGGNLQLQGCGTRTRGLVQTRDIQKVGVEGTTSYALDPVSAPELANGQLAPRRVTINFRHR